MTYQGHIGGGIVASYIVLRSFPTEGPIVLAMGGVCVLASLLPDIDSRSSWLSHRLFLVHALFVISLSNPLTWIVFGHKRMRQFVAHRGFTHSILGIFAATFLCAAVVIGLAEAVQAAGVQLSSVAAGGSPLALGGLVPLQVEIVALVTAAFLGGYLSHVALDMMTVSGVPLLMPWKRTRYYLLPKIFRVRTRSRETNLLHA